MLTTKKSCFENYATALIFDSPHVRQVVTLVLTLSIQPDLKPGGSIKGWCCANQFDIHTGISDSGFNFNN